MTAPQERASLAQQARLAYLESVERGTPLTVQQLAARFGAPEQWATSRLDEVQLLHGVQHSAPTPGPADVAWLDDLGLDQGTPVTSDEAFVELADQLVAGLAQLGTWLENRDTPLPVDVVAQLVDRLGTRAGGELRKTLRRLGDDVQAWSVVPAGTAGDDGVVTGTVPKALTWTGQHPTAFDLGITDEPALEVRAGVLGWVMTWSRDIDDELGMVTDLSRKSADLLGVLKHAEPATPAAENNGGEDVQP